MADLKVSVVTDYNGKGIKEAQAAMDDLNNKTISQLQDRIKGLQKVLDNVKPNTKAFSNYSSELGKAKGALEQLQKAARNGGQILQTSMGGATSSVIEFNRVIQDAPFGIQGVGNNIQSLTQNLAYLVNQTGSARKATSVFFSTLITPANLAVLAVSAITTAWTIYTSQQQKANKANEEAVKQLNEQKSALDDFIETTNVYNRLSVRASSATTEETAKLKALYGVTQDVTLSLKSRNRAADELQKMYPEYFKNQTNEAILTGRVSSEYDRLTTAIIQSGRARAAIDIAAENSAKILKYDIQRRQEAEDRVKLEAKSVNLAKQIKAQGETPFTPGSGPAKLLQTSNKLLGPMTKLAALQNEYLETQDDIAGLDDNQVKRGTDYIKLKQEEISLQNILNDALKKGADITGKPGSDPAGNPKAIKNDPADILGDILKDSANKAATEGLKGAKKQLEELSQEYKAYFDKIDQQVHESAKRGVDISAKAEADKTQLRKDQLARQSAIETTEAERVATEVQRIRNDSGVASEVTQEKEFASLVKWHDAEINKAQGNADILAAIEEGLQARRDAIRQKYYDKYVQAIDKLTDKIRAIEEKGFTANRSGLASETKRLQEEIDKRIKSINELYDAMQKVNGDGIIGSAIIYGMRAASTAGVKGAGAAAQNDTSAQSEKALNMAIGQFTNKMFDSLSNIGKANDEITERYNKARQGATDAEIARLNELERREKAIANNVGTILSGIFENFTSAMDSLFKNTLSNLLKTSFSKGLDDIKLGGLSTKVSSAIVAGAALAGNAISSIGGGKNTATSALGGALSGAASGAVLGSVIPGIGTIAGAIGGGVIGAISGIFGASSKRKQEALQQKQLEEQQKTNALLDRQSRLSYSSQIVGRMTDRGVITGVDVNEYGQLTTTISGNDIVVSYDRTKKKQDRGNG